ncbi:MAG: DUF4367 domain-containing protein [Eubacteriales bacterium]|nr:DUF4367 domain-containing protein [Eubacteriales bacterium]
MKKEFKENEEISEKNLDMQDEIDDETFQRLLEEEFIEREKQIEEALFADKDFEDLVLTKEEVKASYEELMRRFEREKSAEISEEPLPDEKPAHEMALEGKSDLHEGKSQEQKVLPMEAAREEIQERRKKCSESGEYREPDPKILEIRRERGGRIWHRLGKAVGMLTVAVACVFAASMTSEANRNYLVNSVRILSGDDTKTVVYNDESNEDANPDEEKAIAEIEEKLGVEVPEFYYRPYGMEYSNYVIDELTSLARLEYEYKNNLIVLLIDKQNDNRSSRIRSTCGDEQDLIIAGNDGIIVQIKKNSDDKGESYSAEWESNGVTYVLSGKLGIEEIKKIIENMKF